MMNISEKTIQICRENDIKPARSRGQNFLINEKVYDDIVEAAEIKKDDVVLEVGPGLGFLTEKLAKKAKKVIAVELDDKLADLLNKRLKNDGIDNIEVINKNVLDLQLAKHGLEKYKIVANLPYNITSVFLRKFLEVENKPKSMVLMLQKEVAERIAAKPGQMSVLAVSVQFYAEPTVLFNVPASDFYPAPKVDSAVIKIQIPSFKFQVSSDKDFFRLVKFGFSSKRKMLKNNLAAGYHIGQKEAGEIIERAGLEKTARAQELSVDDWKKLLEYFK